MKKVALITGVSRNIGRAISTKYASNGYRIIGTYRSFLDNKDEMEAFRNDFPDSELYKVDFCNQQEVSDFINIIKRKGHQIDVLINNAGIINTSCGKIRNEFLDFDLPSFVDVINCNFLAAARLSVELKDVITEGGSVIIIASGACLHGSYASISYNASKAALVNLMESLSNNYYRYKRVRVNAVSPGWINSVGDTMGAEAESAFMGKVASVTPIGRNGMPDEVADVVYYLSSDEASFITGTNVIVDGGYKNHNVHYLEEAEY